jgi:hypothetical protein
MRKRCSDASWFAAVVMLLAGATACESDDEEPVEEDDREIHALTTDWELDPGKEAYFCIRETAKEDLYITGFDTVNAPGTHHGLVTVGDPDLPDGIVPCTSEDSLSHFQIIYLTGPDKVPWNLPAGMSTKIPAGKQVMLDLHLFNATDSVLSGTSGARFKVTKKPEEMDMLAEVMIMGSVSLQVPPGESTQVGECRMAADTTLLAVGPHMHERGKHIKVVAKSSIVGDKVIYDQPYIFDSSQTFNLLAEEVPMKQGDPVQVHCTYDNESKETVTFGPGAGDEMCFAGLYQYPATGQYWLCAN